MEFVKRKSVNDKLRNYDMISKEDDFIEVTEWANGEGYDITINDNKNISLTCGELDAIIHLTKCLEYDYPTKNE
jgi:hypothetical protein